MSQCTALIPWDERHVGLVTSEPCGLFSCGEYTLCDECGGTIVHFTLADEWCCRCGARGILDYDAWYDEDGELIEDEE